MGRKRKRRVRTVALPRRKITVPKRIRERWLKTHGGTEFRVGTAFSEANISSEKFRKCWKTVQPTMSEDDLFCLFDEAFGSDNDVHRKVKFINCILQLHQGMQETVVSRTRIYVPKRIRERWCSYPCGNNVEFLIGTALSQTNVGAEKFKKCWKTVQPTIPEEELFRLFDKTFGSVDNLRGKVDFIKDILQRHDINIARRYQEAKTTRVHPVVNFALPPIQCISVKVPARIKERWRSTRPNNGTQFLINTALSEAKVSAEKFKKCWKTVQPTIPEEELFRLFDKTFGSVDNPRGKVDFIEDILQRHDKNITRRYQEAKTVVLSCTRINVPKRIRRTWAKTHGGTEFRIGKALFEINVSAEAFKTCWKTVQPTIPAEELVRLFEEAFGSRNNLYAKVGFIRHILQRYHANSSMVIREDSIVSFEDVSTASVTPASQRPSMASVGSQTVSTASVTPASQRPSMVSVGSQTTLSIDPDSLYLGIWD